MKMTISVFMRESRSKKIKNKIRKNKDILILLGIVICLTFIDQIVKFAIIENLYNSSKTILNGVLNLTYVENTGGAFGIGNNSTLMFITVSIIVISLITKFIISKKDEMSTYILIGLGLILGGGIGNLIDRIFKGFVVDYIDFSPLIKYPVFNIADVCVVVGCIIIGIGEINERIQNKRRTTKY